jgi:glycosyltransferase involved in cell wall biosynthesis
MKERSPLANLTFSVIICTHNRSRYLADCITSLQKQRYPFDAYEIVVVDNGSIDDTRPLVERARTKDGEGPSLHYIYEPRLGLNYARNIGAGVARGAILAYIDDDAVAAPDWLTALAEAYEMVNSKRVCIGGKVELWWESCRPTWLPRELESYYSGTSHLGSVPRQLEQGECPVGTNFSLYRTLLLEAGGFSESLGRVGNVLLSNGEVALCRRLLGRGVCLYYTPYAVVYHRVPVARATRCWLLRRVYWQGVSDVIIEEESNPSSRLVLLRHSFGAMWHTLHDLKRMMRAHVRHDPAGSFLYTAYLVGRLGRVRQSLAFAIRGRPDPREGISR